MKIAVSATGPSLDADVDPRFGRCQHFVIVDPDTMEFEAVENSSQMASGGAGIASAQTVANKGVQAVLTGNCGPNAYQTLEAAEIEVVTGVSGKIRDAIEDYKSGRFRATTGPTVKAHSGMGGMGTGRGMGGDTMPSASPLQPTGLGQELETLKAQVQMLGQQLDGILRRVDALEGKGS